MGVGSLKILAGVLVLRAARGVARASATVARASARGVCPVFQRPWRLCPVFRVVVVGRYCTFVTVSIQMTLSQQKGNEEGLGPPLRCSEWETCVDCDWTVGSTRQKRKRTPQDPTTLVRRQNAPRL